MARFFNSERHSWRIMPEHKKSIKLTVEQSCQVLLNNRAATVKQSCQWLLNSCATDCWTIVPATLEKLCPWLLENRASYCWTIVPATVKTNGASDCKKSCASGCWTIVPATVEQSCQLFFSPFFLLFYLFWWNSYRFLRKYFNY